MPERIRLSRKAGFRLPDGAVSVARPHRWGNPFRLGEEVADRAEMIERYTAWLGEQPDLVAAAREELAGKDLACWCRLDEPCHADVLLDVANGESG